MPVSRSPGALHRAMPHPYGRPTANADADASSSKAPEVARYDADWARRVHAANAPRLSLAVDPSDPAFLPDPAPAPRPIPPFASPSTHPSLTLFTGGRGGYSLSKTSPHYDVHANTITLKRSDGDRARAIPSAAPIGRVVGENGELDYYELVRTGDPKMREWLDKLGGYIANEVWGKKGGQAGQSKWTLAKLPKGYKLWVHKKGYVDDEYNVRKDYYLHGSTYVTVFRSPQEFAPHAIWLMNGQEVDSHGNPQCLCQYCSGYSQKDITSHLHKGKSTSHVVSNRLRKLKVEAEDKPITFKDYRSLLSKTEDAEN